MELHDAKAAFEAGGKSPAALYEAAYAYGQSRGFDPMKTGDWNQARLLLVAIAPEHPQAVAEALGMWMLDSNMLTVSDIVERTGFNPAYIRAEIERGNLVAYKHGKSWTVSKRAFREWMSNPRRGSRSKQLDTARDGFAHTSADGAESE